MAEAERAPRTRAGGETGEEVADDVGGFAGTVERAFESPRLCPADTCKRVEISNRWD
jgi:hypothetical protein